MSKNSIERAARKKSLLGEITKELDTKGDAKNSAIETVKDLIVGVVVGGVAGSAIGRASLIVGAAITGLGHYYKNRLASVFGFGMMAAGGYQTAKGVSGTPKEGLQGAMEGAKERILAFKDAMTEKLFLDKVLKPAEKKDESTKGVGEVQYFTYPENKELGKGEKTEDIDMTDLDKLERQIEQSGNSFAKRDNGTGILPAQEMGDIDPSERNF